MNEDMPSIQRLKKIKNFDFYWRIAILLLLVVATTFMFIWLFRFSNEGMECRKDPFVWGADRLNKIYGSPGLLCTCRIGNKFDFSFNENRFNPHLDRLMNWDDYLSKNATSINFK